MPNHEPTDIKWLKEGLNDFRDEMRSGFKEINNRLDMYREDFETKDHAKESRGILWKKIKQIEDERIKEIMDTKADQDDVNDLKDFQNWAVRIVLGTVILAVLALVINQSGAF